MRGKFGRLEDRFGKGRAPGGRPALPDSPFSLFERGWARIARVSHSPICPRCLMPPRASLAARLVVLCSLVAGGLLVLHPAAAEDKPSAEEAKAAAALKRLLDRSKESSTNQAKLRQDLAAFRLAHLGTKSAVKAAELFGELPSPLDKLDKSTIAALEKFDWQPKELVGVLGEHRGRHGNPVASVAFSHDGSFVASGGGTYVRTWNTTNMRLLGLGGHGAVTSIALSKDNKVMVSGSAYGSVVVWDVSKTAGPKHRFTVQAATSAVYGVACHPDNKLIACACFDNVVRVYDISGKEIKEAGQVSGHGKAVRCLAFSPDGKALATGSEDETARTWDFTNSDYKEKSRLEGFGCTVTSVAFTRGGGTLATGCSDGGTRLWTYPPAARAKNPRTAFQGPKTAVTSLSFDAKGTMLAATHSDGVARIWNLSTAPKTGKERHKIEGHQGLVTSVAYSPDNKLLVTGSDDWTVRTWDLTKTKPVERFTPWSHLSHVYSAAYSTDGTTVASGSLDKIVRFWDLARAEPKTRKFLKFEAPVYAVAYSPDGKTIAAGGQSTTIKQWEASKGDTRPPCKGISSYVYSLTYSPDSKYLLTANDKDAVLFQTSTGGEYKRYGPHKTRVTSTNFSPDAKLVVSTSGYYLYDDKGRIVVKDGKYVYTDCVMRLWDRESAEEVTSVKDAPTPFYSAAFSADGATLYAGNYEPVLRRFGFAANKLKEADAWKGVSGYASGIWPTPDGKYVLTRGVSTSLVLWDVSTGKQVKNWAFQEQMGGVAISGDSRHVAVGLGTGVIYVLRIAPAKGKG
jgi:WD40 repeat protein